MMLPDLKTYKKEFLESYSGSPNTLRLYKNAFNLMIKSFKGKFKLYELTGADVTKYHKFLNGHFKSEQSIHRHLSYARSIWKSYWESYKFDVWDLDRKYVLLKDNPFKGKIKTNLPTVKSKIYLSDYEFQKLIHAAVSLPIKDPEQLCDLLYIYRFLGLRKGEALLLKKKMCSPII